MKKIILAYIFVLIFSSCSDRAINDSPSEKVDIQKSSIEIKNLTEKEKIWRLLDIYWIWLEKFDVELFYGDFLTISYNPDDWITNRIYYESWTEIRIKKIVENIYEIKAYREFESYLSSVWDIKNMKEIYEIPNYDWVSWVSHNGILYTNKFVYDLDKWEKILSNERINTYLTHTFEINQNNQIIIRNILSWAKHILSWDISIDDMWNYFIVKDWYIAILPISANKIYYWKVTDEEQIFLKSYNLESEELWCGWWWSIEMYQWFLYINNWKIITKWSCPLFINQTRFNLETEILEENIKWSNMTNYDDFWKLDLY